MLQNRGAVFTGMGIGAGLMYFLDPQGGGRRRALVRDQLVHAGHIASDAAGATARDMAHRTSGVAARLRGSMDRVPVDDAVLVERVRAQLGRAVSHPRAIDVDVTDGVVTLRGPILESEIARLCRAVEGVHGVREVVDALEPHRNADNIPALQGGRRVPAMWQSEWSPTARVLTAIMATAGIGLIARAAAIRRKQNEEIYFTTLSGSSASARPASDRASMASMNSPAANDESGRSSW